MNTQDLRQMLPSEAKKTLMGFLTARIRDAPRDCNENSTYRYVNALQDFEGDEHLWVRTQILPECFEQALKAFEGRHPKHWNETQRKWVRRP